MNEWKDIAPELWRQVDQGAPFNFKISPSARKSLGEILPNHTVNWSLKLGNLNSDLRSIGPTLHSEPRVSRPSEEAVRVAKWIVKDWGGIASGIHVVEHWMQLLHPFTDDRIHAFIHALDRNRSSSWSKILAFAHPSKHAIFDARVAISLNAGLAELDDPRRFHISETRTPLFARTRRQLLPRRRGNEAANSRSYTEYLALLRAFVEARRTESLLSAEMTLFANAPALATRIDAGRP